MYKVPLIVYERTGYQRQPDRLNNLHNEVKYEITSTNRSYQHLTPIPLDLNYDLTIIAKYQADIDKIASNFMVFFNNDIYVSQMHPKYEGLKLNNQIVMSDSVSEEHPDELDGTQDDLITSTFQFTFKTYLFGGTQQAKKRQLSTDLSTVVSSYVYEFQSDAEAADYIKEVPHSKLSTTLTCETQVEVTSYVDGGEDYDDGIPPIKKIDFGFYVVPTKEEFRPWMASVDNGDVAEHRHWAPSSYVSSESYVQISGTRTDDDGNVISVVTGLSTVNDAYAPVDSYCSLEPYVDRIRWEIDGESDRDFPDNVKSTRCP